MVFLFFIFLFVYLKNKGKIKKNIKLGVGRLGRSGRNESEGGKHNILYENLFLIKKILLDVF